MQIINYRASAGTGKTYTIKNEFADAVRDGVGATNILAMTYTEAAAVELRERIRKELEDRKEKACGDERERYARALRELGDAWICTIHGFCQRALAQYPLEAGVDMSTRVDNSDIYLEAGFHDALFENIELIDLARQTGNTKLMEALSADNYGRKTVMDIAGEIHFEFGDIIEPNAPAPRTEIEKLLDELNDVRVFKTIVAGNAKADNVIQNIDHIIGRLNSYKADTCEKLKNGSMQIGDEIKVLKRYDTAYHDNTEARYIRILASKLTDKEIEKAKLPCDVTALPESEFDSEVSALLDSVNGVKLLFDRVEAIKERRGWEKLNAEQVDKLHAEIRKLFMCLLISRTAELSKTKRREAGGMSYDDMLRLTARALAAPDSGLLKALAEKFPVMIVDEFQDTNPLQWRIIKALCDYRDRYIESEPGKERDGRLILAGDPKQSIYSFQGANLATYSKAVKDAVSRILSDSYRFTAPLCKALNRFFEVQTDAGREGEDAENTQPAQSFFGEGVDFKAASTPPFDDEYTEAEHKIALNEGYYSLNIVSSLGIDTARKKLKDIEAAEKKLKDEKKRYDKIKEKTPEQQEEETVVESAMAALSKEKEGLEDKISASKAYFAKEYTAFICREIKRFVENDPYETGKEMKPFSLGDVLVLVRKKKEAEPLIALFQKYGIPFTFYKRGGLFASEEAKSLCAALKAVCLPDRKNLTAALMSDLFRIEPGEISRLYETGLGEYEKRICKWKERLDRTGDLGGTAEAILADLDIHRKALEEGDYRRSANYKQLVGEIRKISVGNPSVLPALEELENKIRQNERENEDEDLMPLDTGNNAVRIMTMHAAKGLEGRIVFVLGGYSDPKSKQYIRIPEATHSIYVLKSKKEAASDEESEYLAKGKRFETEENHRLLYVALTRAKAMLYMPGYYNTGLFSGVSFNLNNEEDGLEPLPDKSFHKWYFRDEPDCSEEQEQEKMPCHDDCSVIYIQADETEYKAVFKEYTSSIDNEKGPITDLTALSVPEVKYGSLAHIGSFSSGASRRKAAGGEPPAEAEDIPGSKDDNGDEAEDYDPSEERLPGGIYTGDLVHKAFECVYNDRDLRRAVMDLDAESPVLKLSGKNEALSEFLLDWPELRELFGNYSRLFPSRHDFRVFVMRMLRYTLNTPLGDLGLSLGELDTVIPELAFFYKEEDRKNDYVTGSADLVFMYGDEYYIIDWKTNVSGGGYSKGNMEGIMTEHDYYRQARIYKTFVDNWLEAAGAGKRTKGVFYVFVRPAEQEHPAAVYSVPFK